MAAMSEYDEHASDPCRTEDSASDDRVLAFVLLFGTMVGSVILAMSTNSYFLILLASALGYTACVIVYGFARNRNGIQRYLFTCPVVVSQYPNLLRRHAVFLAMLIAVVIIALRVNPRPYEWFSAPPGSGSIPLYPIVGITIAILALVEIFMNRGVLERAHNDRFGEPPEPDEPGRDTPISLFGSDQ